uniref:Uncharacterized protein n=1 Tax=Tanacetum cinerariifolium TaxID=118510 RepID=A0A699KTW9_TANCI|nr:hypothetical protein [Tanacetum cinerariifolium]
MYNLTDITTSLRLLISVLPIRTLYGEWHFTIANSMSTVLFLHASPMVIRRCPLPGPLTVSSVIHHVYDLYVIPPLTSISLIALTDVLYQVFQSRVVVPGNLCFSFPGEVLLSGVKVSLLE